MPRPADNGDELAPPLILEWRGMSELWVLTALTPEPTAGTEYVKQAITRMFEEAFGEPLTLGDIMGMYDREPNFEDDFKPGDRMVLMGLEYVGTISTKHGAAEKTLITVITRASYPARKTYSALGVGIAAMAKRAAAADFPHVAEFNRVMLPSGNEVKRFFPVDVSPADWRDGNDGPPVLIENAVDANTGPGLADANADPGF